MFAPDAEYAADRAAALEFADRVAMVRAQLEPIRSRRALIDSYRRESICCLAQALSSGSATEVLEIAYAQRWLELESTPEEEPLESEVLDPAYEY
jgi:hypothetical protein